MEQSAWLPDESSGFPAMDALHCEFFSLLTELSHTDDQQFIARYQPFVARVEQIFAKEEGWMEEAAFPLFREHQEQHARVLSALHHVFPLVAEGELTLGRKIVQTLLPQWLAFHMTTMDMALALALQLREMNSSHSEDPRIVNEAGSLVF